MGNKVLRAAAYVRVSSYQDKQEKSLADQIQMLNDKIAEEENLINVGTYIDQGVTGKYRTKRKQFLNLIKDCIEGKIDVVYCKQMRRFGRNALESMETIEKLREYEIPVRFVMDDVDTIADRDSSRLAMLASMAEDERDSIQENVIWSLRKRLEQGHYIFRPDMLFGYDLDKDKNMILVPNEAKAVKQIFEMYSKGAKYKEIEKWLTNNGFLTRKGNKFCKSSIFDILTNEKYYGDMLIGKSISKGPKRVKNDGEAPMYLFEQHHEPIISRELFEKCQELRKSRYVPQRQTYGGSADAFQRKVYCGQCGGLFIRHGRTNCVNDFSQVAFVCGKATRTNRRECKNKLQRIGTLEDSFIAVFNYLKENPSAIQEIKSNDVDYNDTIQKLEELRKNEKRYFELEIKGLLNETMKKAHTHLVGQMLELEEKKKMFLTRNFEVSACNNNLKQMQKILKESNPLATFDIDIFSKFVKRVLVMDRNNLIYELESGHKIKVEIDDYYKTTDEIRRVYVSE